MEWSGRAPAPPASHARVADLSNPILQDRSGVVFADHHAVYPIFTMMNSASIATGTHPGVHGFYGNVVYALKARGKNAKGIDIDFSAPAFIEDFGVVEAVHESYQGRLTAFTRIEDAKLRRAIVQLVRQIASDDVHGEH
jgi:type I phosphodiesterase/nucleotide pyrophosphatase